MDRVGEGLWRLVLVVGLVVSASAGCATSGQKGKVTFAYRNVDHSGRATRTPIAVGSEVDIQLSPAAEGVSPSEFEVRGASSSNHQVLKVVSVQTGKQGEVVRVRALEPGRATLSVQTSAGDDAIELLVQEVGSVEVRHWLEVVTRRTFGPDAVAMIRGGAAQFWLSKRTEAGRRLAGRGVEAHVEIEPADAASVEMPPGASSAFRVRAERGGSVTLRPKQGDRRHRYDVLPADEVVALNLSSPALPKSSRKEVERAEAHPTSRAERARSERFPQIDTLPKGRQLWLFASATFRDGRRAIGLDGPLSVESQTPETCRVRSGADHSAGLFGGGLVLVEARETGACRVRADLGSASATYTIVVHETSPGGRGG